MTKTKEYALYFSKRKTFVEQILIVDYVSICIK